MLDTSLKKEFLSLSFGLVQSSKLSRHSFTDGKRFFMSNEETITSPTLLFFYDRSERKYLERKFFNCNS